MALAVFEVGSPPGLLASADVLYAVLLKGAAESVLSYMQFCFEVQL